MFNPESMLKVSSSAYTHHVSTAASSPNRKTTADSFNQAIRIMRNNSSFTPGGLQNSSPMKLLRQQLVLQRMRKVGGYIGEVASLNSM
jgi:hypothetical protein